MVCLTKVSECAERRGGLGGRGGGGVGVVVVGGVGGAPEGLTKLPLLSLISVRVETIRRRGAAMRRQTRGGEGGRWGGGGL